MVKYLLMKTLYKNKADKLIEQDKEDNSEENESLEKNNIIITEQELENEIKEKQ